MYAMIHPSLYLVQIATEWGIFRRQMVCATAGYLLSNPPLVCDLPTTFTAVLKSQVPNDLKSKQDMGTTPHKAMGVGSLTTIHRASKCLPQVVWYLQCIPKTNMKAWIRKKPKDCNSKWWTYNTVTYDKKITQGTANGDNNVVARILAWLYAEDVDKLARTQDTYSFWLL